MNRRLASLFVVAAVALTSTSAEAARPKKKAPPARVEPAKPTPPPATPTATSPTLPPRGDDEGGGRRGPARIEFDDRLVQGQTNKANAIYLFERRESAMRSLLKKRTNFHDEIDEMLEDELVR